MVVFNHHGRYCNIVWSCVKSTSVMLLQRNISHAFDMTSNKKKSLHFFHYFLPSFFALESLLKKERQISMEKLLLFSKMLFIKIASNEFLQEMNCCNVAANAKRDQSSKNLGKLHCFQKVVVLSSWFRYQRKKA